MREAFRKKLESYYDEQAKQNDTILKDDTMILDTTTGAKKRDAKEALR